MIMVLHWTRDINFNSRRAKAGGRPCQLTKIGYTCIGVNGCESGRTSHPRLRLGVIELLLHIVQFGSAKDRQCISSCSRLILVLGCKALLAVECSTIHVQDKVNEIILYLAAINEVAQVCLRLSAARSNNLAWNKHVLTTSITALKEHSSYATRSILIYPI